MGEQLSPVHLRITASAVTVAPTSPDGPGNGPELEADITGATDPRTIGLNRDYLVAGITSSPLPAAIPAALAGSRSYYLQWWRRFCPRRAARAPEAVD